MAQTQTTVTLKDVIKKFLMSVCGFTADAAKEITKNQGYDELDEFYLFDDKGVDTLCSIVRKPHASASGSTSGHAVSNLTQEHLKLAIFAMKHFKHVSCKIDLDSLTKKDIIALSQQCKMELTFKNKTKGFAQATFKDLVKTFKTVMEQLEHALGISGIMLAYVPRKNLIPLDEDKDPPTIIRPWMPRRLLTPQSSKNMLPFQASLQKPSHSWKRTDPSATPSASTW
jgi:hypothetical protein